MADSIHIGNIYVNHTETTRSQPPGIIRAMQTFGGRLRSARVALGLSQEQLGFELGVGKAAVSKWESDRAEPPYASLVTLSRLFRMTLDELVAGTPPSMDTAVREASSAYVMAIAAPSPLEDVLLKRFRALPRARQRAILELMKPVAPGELPNE